MEELTRQDVIDFISVEGLNLFGHYANEIAELVADEVLAEYNEAGDNDLPKAVAYVIGDKFGMFAGFWNSLA